MKLARSNLWDWFTDKGLLKEKYMHAAGCGTAVKIYKYMVFAN
jgi:hypothetical protein